MNLAVTTSSSSNRRGGFPGGFTPPDFAISGSPAGGAASTGQPAAGERSRTSSGATASGKVTEVSRVADASSGVAGYQVDVEFEGSTDEFFVGTTVSADIVIAQRTDVVQVSSRAVTTTDAGSTVEVSLDGKADGKTETRTVEVGLTADGMTEITSGLRAGEQVVLSFPGRPIGAVATGAP